MTSMGQSSLLSKAFLRIMASSHMSPNRRIFPNIIATYGRSLYALNLSMGSHGNPKITVAEHHSIAEVEI